MGQLGHRTGADVAHQHRFVGEVRSTGSNRVYTSASPPNQMASFFDAAPRGPPDTGASNTCTPRSAKRAWIPRSTVGELVDRSK
ncbi:MAG: hypothetical protein R2755_07180 [Acidimicrobiales bacterium]